MITSHKVITAKQIRQIGFQPETIAGLDYRWEHGTDRHYVTANGERVFCIEGAKGDKLCSQSLKKIRRMGLGFGHKVMLTDEEKGIAEAGRRGENPFAYKMLRG